MKQEFYEVLGVSLGNVCNILDPEIIVMGGGLSNHEPLYRDSKKTYTETHFFGRFYDCICEKQIGGFSRSNWRSNISLLAHDFNLHLMEIKIMDKLQTKSVKIEQTIRLV
ncbi:MAG: hypothetical protein CM15mP58_01990 [Burkholderiaceae bacterium]|nr:MAG: hypothetical protein CM15mP58_01990 [Burkholderiaceae bacterium]